MFRDLEIPLTHISLSWRAHMILTRVLSANTLKRSAISKIVSSSSIPRRIFPTNSSVSQSQISSPIVSLE